MGAQFTKVWSGSPDPLPTTLSQVGVVGYAPGVATVTLGPNSPASVTLSWFGMTEQSGVWTQLATFTLQPGGSLVSTVTPPTQNPLVVRNPLSIATTPAGVPIAPAVSALSFGISVAQPRANFTNAFLALVSTTAPIGAGFPITVTDFQPVPIQNLAAL